MNKFLADGISTLNSLFALAIVGFCGFVGNARWGDGGLVVGLLIGFAFAVLICGTLAVFLDMRDELATIRAATAEQTKMQADALSAISKQLGAIHLALAERPLSAPASADKPQAPLGWCPACGQRRVLDSEQCVWCGVEKPAVAAKPDVEMHA